MCSLAVEAVNDAVVMGMSLNCGYLCMLCLWLGCYLWLMAVVSTLVIIDVLSGISSV
jgi:hypothetical protein